MPQPTILEQYAAFKLKNLSYFKESDFKCSCCGKLPPGGINLELLCKLSFIRWLWGKAIGLSSGYRCEKHNKEIGGAEHSQHLLGNAGDLKDPDDSLDAFIQEEWLVELELSREPLVKTRGWVHLDTAARDGKYGTFK